MYTITKVESVIKKKQTIIYPQYNGINVNSLKKFKQLVAENEKVSVSSINLTYINHAESY